MARVRSILVGICLLLFVAAPARASQVNFDDLAVVFDDPLASPYQGFDWENFRYFSLNFDGGATDGFDAGVVSPENAVYSGGEFAVSGPIVGKFSRVTPFDFTSAWLGAPIQNTMNLTVEGLLGGSLKFSQVVSVDNNGADLFAFNFTNIDTVRLIGSNTAGDQCGGFNCGLFTLDNFVYGPATITETPVPEPSTLSLLGLGGLAMLGKRRSLKAA